MEFMFDWEGGDGDRFSFEDSDRFEEDSLCSWISEPESLCNNWRGWRKQTSGGGGGGCGGGLGGSSSLNQSLQGGSKRTNEGQVTSLVELGAQAVACHIPFEVVEHFFPPIPEQLQLRIAFWSFPENEEDIRLYSCLAKGSADEFQKGETLFKSKSVSEALQIGFHLSATVTPPPNLVTQGKTFFNVALVFDRRHITQCSCTCSDKSSWCAHIVALCLFRIHQANDVCLRAPVSESLSRLERDQLQKFAQYLISELPQQILPTAQRLLDELLSSQQAAINTVCGAPDPTAGSSAGEQTTWCLDEVTLHENIKKTLIKFCIPSPMVLSDVNYLSSNAPPAATEWQSLLRPLRGREPEGIWNLLSIVREMFRRNDSNAIPLLEILTEEVLACEQILFWWFNNKLINVTSLYTNRGGGGGNSQNSSHHAASSLCDEIVILWRLAALNPALSSTERDGLCAQMKKWHIQCVEKLRKSRANPSQQNSGSLANNWSSDIDCFPGFKPAIETCCLNWNDYLSPGVNYIYRYQNDCATAASNTALFLNTMRHDADGKIVTHAKGYGTSQVSCTQKLSSSAAAPSSSLEQDDPTEDSEREDKKRDNAANDISASRRRRDGGSAVDNCSSGSEGFYEGEKKKCGGGRKEKGASGDTGGAKAEERRRGEGEEGFSDCESVSSIKGGKGGEGEKGEEGGRGKKRGGKGGVEEVTERLKKNCDLAESLSRSTGAAVGSRDIAPASHPVAPAGGCKGSTPRVKAPATALGMPTATPAASSTPSNTETVALSEEEEKYFTDLKKLENQQDIMFALAEALHAHGHVREASNLARQLAGEMLTLHSELNAEQQPTAVSATAAKNHRKKKAPGYLTSFSASPLVKASFLCLVLLDDPDCRNLAFRVGLLGLEMARPPAATKSLEVKLAYQESELVNQLKKISLGPAELSIIRDRAEKLRDGKLKSRGDALLPISLAGFVFDTLCFPGVKYVGGPVVSSRSLHTSSSSVTVSLSQQDEQLGFEAAVATLGLKANVSEAEHPLLCEGTRRQRGELIVSMLIHYKDDPVKLARIMDKVLDKEIHQLYKVDSDSFYFTQIMANPPPPTSSSSPAIGGAVVPLLLTDKSRESAGLGVPVSGRGTGSKSGSSAYVAEGLAGGSAAVVSGSVAGGSVTTASKHSKKSAASIAAVDTADDDTAEGESDFKAWEAKFRCTNLKTAKKHSVGMASIDSSAPETTSSDNSPTLVRRSAVVGVQSSSAHHGHAGRPGSDSGSSHNSSDSVNSSSSGFKASHQAKTNDESMQNIVEASYSTYQATCQFNSRCSTPSMKTSGRYKGKSRAMPMVPNQPSEALAHFMFELAKTVLVKAGGSSSTSLFVNNQGGSNNNNGSGPHRALHLCAFHIGLYALGLNNCVSPNWLSRTYSSHVSWITGQAVEIGYAAINVLIHTWDGHLTPQEVASLADRASRCRDPNMVRAAAELALSSLPLVQALNTNEIQRVLVQCKEQSREMLERACLSVEMAAKEGGVFHGVLFDVAKRWYELYDESRQGPAHRHGDPLVSHTIASIPVSQQLQPADQQQAQLCASAACVPALATARVGIPQSMPPMQPQMQQQQQPIQYAEYVMPPPQAQAPQLHVHPKPYLAQYAYLQPMTHASPPPSVMTTFPQYYNIHQAQQQLPPQQQQALQLQLQQLQPVQMQSMHIQQQQQQQQQQPQKIMHGQQPQQAMHMTRYPCLIQSTVMQQHQSLTGGSVASVAPPPMYHPGGGASNIIQYQGGPAGAQNQMVAIHQQPPQNWVQLSYKPHSTGDAPLLHTQPPPPVSLSLSRPPLPPGHAAAEGSCNPENATPLNYVMAAFRVGMLAMDTLARRVHDDRPHIKYARNPPYGEDVKWLHTVAMKLGTSYLQQFCASAVNTIVSPFILLDITIETANFLIGPESHQIRLPTLNSLLQRCLQMFVQCTHTRIHHITPSDYEEFVAIVCSARNAFCMAPGGMVQFNEMLQGLRRSKSCKKELWQRIISGLHGSSSNMQ